MKRSAALVRVTILAVVLASIASGGLAVYFYTLPPASANADTGSATATSQALANQASSRQLVTVEYNGTTYQVPPKGPNSPSFSCPAGTDPSLCATLQETCGNGVGSAQEPWKSCYNCPFDAGCTGDNSCDPYTHECSSPVSACMVIAGGYSQAG